MGRKVRRYFQSTQRYLENVALRVRFTIDDIMYHLKRELTLQTIKDKVKQKSSTNTKNFDFQYYINKTNSVFPYNNPNIGSKMLLISSSSGEETSLTDTKNQHGLFTYYLLKYLKESKGLLLK